MEGGAESPTEPGSRTGREEMENNIPVLDPESLYLDSNIYEFLDSAHNSSLSDKIINRISNIINVYDKQMHKTLLSHIDNYNKYIVESVEYISRKSPRNVERVRQPVVEANDQLGGAAKRLKDKDLISALNLLYSARERKIKIFRILDDSDGGNRVDLFINRVIDRCEHYKGKEWGERIREELLTEEGRVKEKVSNQTLISRYRQWHSKLLSDIISILMIRKILGMFTYWTAFILLPIIGTIIFITDLQTVFVPSQYETAAEAQFSIMYQFPFLVLVFLLGVLGSAVNTVRTWPTQLIQRKLEVPRISVTKRLFGARLLFGGIAASFMYLILIAELIQVRVTPGWLLAIAFGVGFSDQFFVKSIERVLESETREGSLSPRLFEDNTNISDKND